MHQRPHGCTEIRRWGKHHIRELCRLAARSRIGRGLAQQRVREEQAKRFGPATIEKFDLIGLAGIEEQELVSREIVVHPIDAVTGNTSGDPLQRVCAVLLAGNKPARHPVQNGDCGSILWAPKRSPIWRVAGSAISPDDVDTGLHRGTMADLNLDLKACW